MISIVVDIIVIIIIIIIIIVIIIIIIIIIIVIVMISSSSWTWAPSNYSASRKLLFALFSICEKAYAVQVSLLLSSGADRLLISVAIVMIGPM